YPRRKAPKGTVASVASERRAGKAKRAYVAKAKSSCSPIAGVGLKGVYARLCQAMTSAAFLALSYIFSIRHARACRGHPRLAFAEYGKTWMAGTSPAMTNGTRKPPI